MWPHDFIGRRDVVRIGAHAAELWRGTSRGLECVARMALPCRASLYNPETLTIPLHSVTRQVEVGRATLVLESAFAPVLLADTGGALTRRQQVQALLRHRFGLAYGEPGADVASWTLRTDHRFGDRFALAYALPPAVERVLVECAQSTNRVFAAWYPALAWSLARFAPSRHWPMRLGWWVWPEQDRSLVLRLAGGRAEALNPAAPSRGTATEWVRVIAGEGARFGLDADTGPIGVGHWQRDEGPTGRDDRVQCFSVVREQVASEHAETIAAQDAQAAA